MSDDISDIWHFYDHNVDVEDERLAHHQLEFDLTWRYLTRNLPPAGAILEIGAATGRYTLALAKLGYAVTAVDLSAALLERCQERLAAAGLQGQVRCVVADARDLQPVPATAFDAVLLMGPLYHLVEPADRLAALQQATARLRRGGLLVSVFLSRLGVLGDILQRTPAWIELDDNVRWHMTRGRRPDQQPTGGFRGYFAQVEEITPLHEALGLETLVLAGLEPAIAADDDSYNRLPAPQRERWLELLFAVSSDAAIVGASRHLLYVGRKGDGEGTVSVARAS